MLNGSFFILNVLMLNALKLNVLMLNVLMLNVVTPHHDIADNDS